MPTGHQLIALLLLLCPLAAEGGEANVASTEATFTSSFDGTGPLRVRAYLPSGTKVPVMVLMHGYDGSRDLVTASAQRMANLGYLCLCVDTRGWGGSAGHHDDGGLEILDINDAIDMAAQSYASQIDLGRISIIGYGPGGGNVVGACVHFPYRFRAAMAISAVPDYGQWIALNHGVAAKVIEAVAGDPIRVPEKYQMRNAGLAAVNLLAGTRLHLAYDEQESACPIRMDMDFVAAAKKAGVQDLWMHASRVGDTQRWTEGYNDDDHLSALEDAFLADIQKNAPIGTELQMPASGRLVVLGFIVTPRFSCFLGSGDDAVATVTYSFSRTKASFSFKPLAGHPSAKAVVTLRDPSPPHPLAVVVGGSITGSIPVAAKATGETTTDSTLEFRSHH